MRGWEITTFYSIHSIISICTQVSAVAVHLLYMPTGWRWWVKEYNSIVPLSLTALPSPALFNFMKLSSIFSPPAAVPAFITTIIILGRPACSISSGEEPSERLFYVHLLYIFPAIKTIRTRTQSAENCFCLKTECKS